MDIVVKLCLCAWFCWYLFFVSEHCSLGMNRVPSPSQSTSTEVDSCKYGNVEPPFGEMGKRNELDTVLVEGTPHHK